MTAFVCLSVSDFLPSSNIIKVAPGSTGGWSGEACRLQVEGVLGSETGTLEKKSRLQVEE
jgi:hypothetical protein